LKVSCYSVEHNLLDYFWYRTTQIQVHTLSSFVDNFEMKVPGLLLKGSCNTYLISHLENIPSILNWKLKVLVCFIKNKHNRYWKWVGSCPSRFSFKTGSLKRCKTHLTHWSTSHFLKIHSFAFYRSTFIFFYNLTIFLLSTIIKESFRTK
jgi:hypothetical protein